MPPILGITQHIDIRGYHDLPPSTRTDWIRDTRFKVPPGPKTMRAWSRKPSQACDSNLELSSEVPRKLRGAIAWEDDHVGRGLYFNEAVNRKFRAALFAALWAMGLLMMFKSELVIAWYMCVVCLLALRGLLRKHGANHVN
jgi:hypothetical protein